MMYGGMIESETPSWVGDDEPQPPDPERAQELKHRYRSARRSGMNVRDSQLFATSDTPLPILLLCVRRGATVEQLRAVCL